MRDPYLKIISLLAASGYRRTEIFDFLFELRKKNPDAVMDDIMEFRSLTQSSAGVRSLDIPVDTYSASSSDFDLRIERLLILDAGLPRTAAIEAMTYELKSRYPHIPVPSEARKGFRYWLRRLGTLYPEKELLFIATTLRNRSVHDAPSAWRLK